MITEPYLAGVYVRYLPVELANYGYDPSPFLKRHSLSRERLNQNNISLGYREYLAFLNDVLNHTDIPALGLKTAGHINLLNQGLFGHAISCCKNLKQAFSIHQNYFILQSDIIPGCLEIEDELASYTVNISLFSYSDAITQFEVEQDFAMWFRSAEDFWEKRIPWIKEIHFSTRRPGNFLEYMDYFQCPVRFQQKDNRFFFDKKYLEQPFTGFDALLNKITEEQCARLLEEQFASNSLRQRIIQVLEKSGNRIPSVVDIANRFNISEITLRRRLNKEGTHYKALLLEFRMNLAKRYLLETGLSVKEIAHFTGYTNPANFSRTFTQYHSLPPKHYRAKYSPLKSSEPYN